MDTDKLEVPDNAQQKLAEMRALPKFVPDDTRFPPYVGYLPADERPSAEQQVNLLIDHITAGINANPTKSFVLKEFRNTFDYFELSDTEDRERFCSYLEDIMDAIGMESSDGAINKWMYGF